MFKIKFITVEKNGNVSMPKEDFEAMVKEAYDEGFKDGVITEHKDKEKEKPIVITNPIGTYPNYTNPNYYDYYKVTCDTAATDPNTFKAEWSCSDALNDFITTTKK